MVPFFPFGLRPVAKNKHTDTTKPHHPVSPQGLMPLFIDPTTGAFTKDQVSLGALGDSYYEYLLKVWCLYAFHHLCLFWCRWAP